MRRRTSAGAAGPPRAGEVAGAPDRGEEAVLALVERLHLGFLGGDRGGGPGGGEEEVGAVEQHQGDERHGQGGGTAQRAAQLEAASPAATAELGGVHDHQAGDHQHQGHARAEHAAVGGLEQGAGEDHRQGGGEGEGGVGGVGHQRRGGGGGQGAERGKHEG